MYALLTGSPSYLSLSSLTATSILKFVNSSETWRNKLTFIAIFPGIICICFTYLSSLYHSNLPSTALYLLILLPYTLPLRYPPPSLMLILPLPTFTLRGSVGYPLHVLSTVLNHFYSTVVHNVHKFFFYPQWISLYIRCDECTPLH